MPKVKDPKKLDFFGRKVYTTGGLQLHIANQQTLLGCYDFNMCDAIQKFKDWLPQEARQEFSSLVDEAKTVARASLQAALDMSDCAARSRS